jgi:hypothetical protein
VLRQLRQMRAQVLGAAVLPPVRHGVTIRPPQPAQPRLASMSGGPR